MPDRDRFIACIRRQPVDRPVLFEHYIEWPIIWRALGEDRVEVTYEWIVNEKLDTDYTCFVHAVNLQDLNGQHIVFQGDHGLPKPTSQWREGETIVDGPHLLRVSDRFDRYDLTIGLYKGGRVALKGLDTGEQRILLARLKVDKQAGRITNITAEKVTADSVPAVTADRKGVKKADFAAHTNPRGTLVDFGKVTTDGSVKINREKDSLVIFPYPREKKFRVSLDLKSLRIFFNNIQRTTAD